MEHMRQRLHFRHTFLENLSPFIFLIKYSAYRFYVEGVEVASNGRVGDGQTHKAEMAPRTACFVPNKTKIQLVIQASSFQHIRGGLENSIYLDEAHFVTEKYSKRINLSLFMISALVVIGLFTLSFVSIRREEIGFLIFGFFSLFVALRALFTDPFYYTVLFPKMSWLWGTRLEYVLTLLSSWSFVLLMKSWYKHSFSNKVVVFLSAFLLPLALLTLFTQPVLFQDLFFKIALLAVPTGIYFIYLTFKEVKQQNTQAKINIVGIFLIFIAFLNDFAIANDYYQFYTLMLPATAMYVFLHMIQLSIDFAKMMKNQEKSNRKLITLNASLDDQVYQRTLELEEANKQLKEQAMIDSLTGIANRRSFNEFLTKEFAEAKRTGKPLAILMLDMDEFKKYNDFFGHPKGDWLLQKVTTIIEQVIPENGFFARYGGEEFSIIFPNTTIEKAAELAENVRQAVASYKIEHPEGKFNIVTLSIGLALLSDEDPYESEASLINAADEQLYIAKENGRNQVMYKNK